MDLQSRMKTAETTTSLAEQSCIARQESLRDIVAALGRNINLHEEVQEILLQRKDSDALVELARNPAATPTVQDRLLALWDGCFEQHLVENPSLHLRMQQLLSKGPYKALLAANPNLDPSVMRVMWGDGPANPFRGSFPYNLTVHPSLPKDLKSQVLTSAILGARMTLALNPGLDAEEWDALASDVYPGTRRNLAQNLACPLPILRRLSTDPATEVRIMVTTREDLPEDLYRDMSFDPDPWVRSTLAGNSAVVCTEDFRAQVVKDHSPSLYQQAITTGNVEAAEAIVEDWPGSLEDLVEMSLLVNR